MRYTRLRPARRHLAHRDAPAPARCMRPICRLRPDGDAGLLVASFAGILPLRARAGMDVGASGADARSIRRRRRRHRRRLRVRARGDSATAARPSRLHCRRDRDARADGRGPPQPHGALRPQARRRRHGGRRIRRAVPRARARARASGPDTQCRQHRAARHRRRARPRAGIAGGRCGRCLSRFSPAAAPDPADRRGARAGRAGRAVGAPERGRGPVGARVRRAASRRTPPRRRPAR